MQKYNLPKQYLSYSQVSLWLKNKEQYRSKYYLNEPTFETTESLYGKLIAKIMEDPVEIAKNPTLALVPRYSEPEYDITVDIEGIPVRGYIDSYDPDTHSFYEYKTSHTNSWNKVSVAKHLQLPFYSLLIEEKHKKVNRTCHLVWIETEFSKKTIEFAGHTLEADSRELRLTGKIETFKRIIPKWERERVRQLIVKVAEEIHEDYKRNK